MAPMSLTSEEVAPSVEQCAEVRGHSVVM